MPQDSTPPPPETQHTALPWQRNGQTLQGWWRIDGCSERVGLEFMANPVAVMPNDADADLAVRAVNNHESLLAALEGLADLLAGMAHDAFQEGLIDLGDALSSVAQHARAAIAQAKGEPE